MHKLKRGELSYFYAEGVDQVFFLESAVTIPNMYAVHTWIVTCDKDNNVIRWDFGPDKDKDQGKIYKNELYPEKGMNIIPYISTPSWPTKLIEEIKGDKANKIINFLRKNATKFPYKDEYKLLGPNSNTFPQWVLNQFPEVDVKLSWRAIGKNYSEKEKK